MLNSENNSDDTVPLIEDEIVTKLIQLRGVSIFLGTDCGIYIS